MSINLQPLLSILGAANLTDLVINGTGEAFADFGSGLKRVPHPCPDARQLDEIARWILAQADRHLDFANPFADCALTAAQLGLEQAATFRVHTALASASSKDTLISIRKHSGVHPELTSFASGCLELQVWLKDLVEKRANFLVSGATGSGKTSLVGAMMSCAGDDRIIAIEDVSELWASNGHFLGLQTRQANTEGKGEIGLDYLARQALRMRPDRLLVGEIRGPELLTFINALNTGHKGAGATIHANSASAVAARIESIGLQAGWNSAAVAAGAVEAIDFVIHLEKHAGYRFISQISTLGRSRRGGLVANPFGEIQKFLPMVSGFD